jgi:hypothetical protein
MSSIEFFQSQVAELIKTTVLTPLVDWLQKEKSVSTTVNELIEVLNLPKTNTPPTLIQRSLSSVLNPTLPSVVPVSTPSVGAKSKPKSKPSIPENYTGPTCKYVFKRGESKGNACGKPTVNGSDFCEQCNSKKTNSKSTVETKPAKPVETKPTVGFTTSIAKRSEKPKIELRELNGQPNTFVDIQTNIVVKKVQEKEDEKPIYVAVGIQEESGFRTLTEEEKKEALLRNFTLQNEIGKEQSKEQVKENLKEEVKEEKKQEVKSKPATIGITKITTNHPVSKIPDIDDE